MVIAARGMAAGGIVAIIFVTQETKLCVWSGRRRGQLGETDIIYGRRKPDL